MHTMPSLDYMGYAVAVDAPPAPSNRYYSVFAIHRHAANTMTAQTVPACHQGIAEEAVFDTAELAYKNATERARTWIEAHPVR